MAAGSVTFPRKRDEANDEATELRGPDCHSDVSLRVGTAGERVWDDAGTDVEGRDARV